MTLAHNNCIPHILLALVFCLMAGVIWQQAPHPIMVVIIGLVPLAALFVAQQPFLMVLLFVLFSFFRLHEVFPQLYNMKIPLLLSMASLSALLWHVGLTRKITVYWSRELTAVSIFFMLVMVGVILASNRPIALSYFNAIYWKIAVMTFAIAWLTRSARDFALASWLITLAGLLVGAVALSNQYHDIGLVEGTRVTIGRQLGSVLGDPNDLALVLMFPVSFAISLMLNRDLGRFSQILGLITMPILFAAVLATQSRGGLLGIMAVFGVYTYRRVQSKALVMVIGVVVTVAIFALAGISERSSGGAAEAGVDASAMGRLYAWEAALGMALNNPLSGVGIDNFYANYFFYSPHWDGLNHAVHSTWFGVLAETGFLGLVVFISIIVMLIKTALNTLNQIEQQRHQFAPAIHASAQAVLAGLIGTVVSGTFLTQGFTWPIYILAALVVAISHQVKTQQDSSHASK
jgi:probable O-glycosylation ligase (exosortase A-associated)